MSTAQTSTSAFWQGRTAPDNPSAPGTPQWFYDEIMRWIEPDLLSTVIPRHAEKYKDQTPEQTIERMAKYDEAFAIYDDVTKDVEVDYLDALRAAGTAAREKVHAEEREEQNKNIQSIQDKLDASSTS